MIQGVRSVLDASALLAMLHAESGAADVERAVPHAAISAVNWSEVVQKSIARRVDTTGMRTELEALGLQIIPFTADHAERAASLWSDTEGAGLSLGDRACLALGLEFTLPVLTADRTWKALRIGAKIRAIR